LKLAAAIALLTIAGGCRTRPFDEAPLSSTDGAAPIASADLARPSACMLLFQCMLNCVQQVQDFAPQNCFDGCRSFANVVTPPPSFTLANVGGCAQQSCLGMLWGDSIPPKNVPCTVNGDQTALVDGNGVAPGSCAACLHDAMAIEMELPCDPSHPACVQPLCGVIHQRFCAD
jgi:hypothetical protein